MRSMNASHLLCAVLACAPLTVDALAPASSEDSSSSAVANAGGVAGQAVPTQGRSSKAGRAGDSESSHAGVRTRSVMPQRGRGTGGSAERLHSPLNAQERGRLAHQPGRPIGSTRAATGVPGVRTPNAVGAAGQSKLAASKRIASPAPKLTAIPRDSAIGGPHAQSVGRLGGPAIDRTNQSATIDGRKFGRK
jgi:hypothetical protein